MLVFLHLASLQSKDFHIPFKMSFNCKYILAKLIQLPSFSPFLLHYPNRESLGRYILFLSLLCLQVESVESHRSNAIKSYSLSQPGCSLQTFTIKAMQIKGRLHFSSNKQLDSAGVWWARQGIAPFKPLSEPSKHFLPVWLVLNFQWQVGWW